MSSMLRCGVIGSKIRGAGIGEVNISYVQRTQGQAAFKVDCMRRKNTIIVQGASPQAPEEILPVTLGLNIFHHTTRLAKFSVENLQGVSTNDS